ncbi:ATP-dependent zinc metalloprotease, putative [Babesia caballi]|uniref:ATP-dependent zinc metalloprotease, putative n=1 Tax=Babesia caballi TaxID=5871 RepID=A0AAV4M094_BABCB|nr:ATP-dependent zinc metalloprotease, putative [Babesia caballi]
MWRPSTTPARGFYTVQLFHDLLLAHNRGVCSTSAAALRTAADPRGPPPATPSLSKPPSRALRGRQVAAKGEHTNAMTVEAPPRSLCQLQLKFVPRPLLPAPHVRLLQRQLSTAVQQEPQPYRPTVTSEAHSQPQHGTAVLPNVTASNVTAATVSETQAEVKPTALATTLKPAPPDSSGNSAKSKRKDVLSETKETPKTAATAPSDDPPQGSLATTTQGTSSVAEAQNQALDAAFELSEGESLDWNNKQLCKVSHRNLLLYAYNHLDMATVVKITNQVLAAYQTLPRRRKASQRRQYVQRFLRCIRKHEPLEDHRQLARWLLRCIDLLTCDDLYSMLRVRHILNYDNSFETFRASFGMENFESFSNVRTSKVQQDKLIGEKALKSRTAQRNLLMRHLKINKFRFLKDQNVTKAVYEANIEWLDAGVDAAPLDAERFAFVYNLPFIEHGELSAALHEVLSRFSTVRRVDILFDRIPPLTTMVRRSAVARNSAPPPRDKYSPLYALVEFDTKADRDYICDEHIRVFGLLCCGRVVYPELAERKCSLLTALYPPFRRMADALQFIANALVEQPGDVATLSHASESHAATTAASVTTNGVPLQSMGHGTSALQTNPPPGSPSHAPQTDVTVNSTHTAVDTEADIVTVVPSHCRIMPSSKRKKGAAGQSPVVTADAQRPVTTGDWPACPPPEPDNHVDSSMLEKLQNKAVANGSMDPQWVVLRFRDFKHAYFARLRLLQKFADEPRSLVSFDTKRSIFHNGKYVDLPLFQYSPRAENDPSVARITQSAVDSAACGGPLGGTAT